MKRLIVIAITIAVFAAMILPTATVMGSTLYFHEVFSDPEDIFGAQGEVWGSYDIGSNYLSASIYVEPTSAFHYVFVYLYVDLNGDGDPGLDEPYFEATNSLEAYGSDEWFDPLELTYSGYVPTWASVHYIVQTISVWIPEVGKYGWGTDWYLGLEDFEWGSNGVSLATSGGDVTWGVQASGSSKAVITTTHKYGTRGGKLYCDGDHTVIASYQQSPAPTDRGFYIRKDNGAYFHTGNTYNWRRISVTIDTNEVLKYYDTSFHNVCQLDDNTWYLIEFKNINYSASTFDIYVDGEPVKMGATMSFSWGRYSPVTYSSATTSGGHGSVYLDDIY
jgi:hypothetical protein